jgi:hypothetical protein
MDVGIIRLLVDCYFFRCFGLGCLDTASVMSLNLIFWGGRVRISKLRIRRSYRALKVLKVVDL